MFLALEFIQNLETAFGLLLYFSESGLVEQISEEGKIIATSKDNSIELVFVVADVSEILKNFREIVLFFIHFEARAEKVGLDYFSACIEIIGARADETLLFEDHSDDGVDCFRRYFL